MARREAAPPAKPEITRAQLLALVAEINTVLNLEPQMAFTRKNTDEDIIAKIHEECDGNLYDQDFTPDPNDESIPVFSETAEELFGELSIEILEGAPPAEEPEPAPEKSKKTPPPAKGKGAAAPAKGKDKPAPAPKAKKEPAEPKYSRKQAFADVVRSGVTDCAEITKKSSELYEKHGGKANTTSEGWYVAEYGQLLADLGFATYDKKTLIIHGVNDTKKKK